MTDPASIDASGTRSLRLAVLGLSGVAIAGVAVELGVSRHWQSAVQMIAWVCATLLGLAAALAYRVVENGSSPRTPRFIAAAVCGASVFGVWEHVEGNHEAGPLDFRYATTWETMSETSRWWKAISGGVGAAPPIVPGVLAFVAAMIVVATLGLRSRVH